MAEGLTQLVEEVIAEIRRTFKNNDGSTEGSFVEPILAFVHAVDWTEPWIVGLMTFHILLLLFVIKTRKRSNTQMATFFLTIVGIYFAERLNTVLGRHWESFARQPYFDKHGIFMSTMWSGPLLLIACLILVNSLITLASLMVKWKRAELKYKALMTQKND